VSLTYTRTARKANGLLIPAWLTGRLACPGELADLPFTFDLANPTDCWYSDDNSQQ